MKNVTRLQIIIFAQCPQKGSKYIGNYQALGQISGSSVSAPVREGRGHPRAGGASLKSIKIWITVPN
jgi:hypothetical protein